MQWANVSCLPESGCCCLFIPFFHFSFSPIFKTFTFSSHFSQELWDLADWNLAHTWTVDKCIVYTVFRLQLFICPFISSFFSLQFSNILNFRHTFLRLRNCVAKKVETWQTHEQWADVSCILESVCCCLPIPLFFIFLSLQFSNIKLFCHTFLSNCEALKVETWYTRGQWADVLCVPESGCCCLFVPLFLHFLSLNFYFFLFL